MDKNTRVSARTLHTLKLNSLNFITGYLLHREILKIMMRNSIAQALCNLHLKAENLNMGQERGVQKRGK